MSCISYCSDLRTLLSNITDKKGCISALFSIELKIEQSLCVTKTSY